MYNDSGLVQKQTSSGVVYRKRINEVVLCILTNRLACKKGESQFAASSARVGRLQGSSDNIVSLGGSAVGEGSWGAK